MINTKLTDGVLPNLTSPANDDLFYVVDVGDSTDHAAGTSKVITFENLFGLHTLTSVFEEEHNADGTHSTITTDNINESTSAAGVTIDSVLLKDGDVQLADGKGIVGTMAGGDPKTIVALDGDTFYSGNSAVPAIHRGTTHTFWDAAGKVVAQLLAGIASAVNYFTFQNSATGNDLALTAAGSDTDIDIYASGKGAGKFLVNLTNALYSGNPNMSLANNTNWQDVTGVTVSVATRKASKVMVRASFYHAFSTSYTNYGFAVRILDHNGVTVGTSGYWDLRGNANLTSTLTGVYTSSTAETATFKLQASKGDASAVYVVVNANLEALVVPD